MLACCVDVEVRTSTDASHMSGNDWLGEEERRRKAEKRREKREEGNRQGGRVEHETRQPHTIAQTTAQIKHP